MRPGASRSAAANPLGPRGPCRSAPPELLGLLWATRLEMRDDASRRISAGGSLASPPCREGLSNPLPASLGLPQGFTMLSVCHKWPYRAFGLSGLGFLCSERFAAENLCFLASSRDLGRPPPGASSRPLAGSRGSQSNRADSRRAPPNPAKRHPSQGHPGGRGLHTDTHFFAA